MKDKEFKEYFKNYIVGRPIGFQLRHEDDKSIVYFACGDRGSEIEYTSYSSWHSYYLLALAIGLQNHSHNGYLHVYYSWKYRCKKIMTLREYIGFALTASALRNRYKYWKSRLLMSCLRRILVMLSKS